MIRTAVGLLAAVTITAVVMIQVVSSDPSVTTPPIRLDTRPVADPDIGDVIVISPRPRLVGGPDTGTDGSDRSDDRGEAQDRTAGDEPSPDADAAVGGTGGDPDGDAEAEAETGGETGGEDESGAGPGTGSLFGPGAPGGVGGGPDPGDPPDPPEDPTDPPDPVEDPADPSLDPLDPPDDDDADDDIDGNIDGNVDSDIDGNTDSSIDGDQGVSAASAIAGGSAGIGHSPDGAGDVPSVGHGDLGGP